MSRSRPINRRPWRRAPWRKSSRPKRWISLNSGISIADPVVAAPPWNFSLMSDDASSGQPPAVTLATGQLDVEPWADNQEVLIDRIVGDINIRGIAANVWDAEPAYIVAPAVYLRLGMLVQEEGDATSPPLIALGNDEHLEDYEWMWLASFTPQEWNYTPTGGTAGTYIAGMGFSQTLHLDLRVKRKLGQTDQLLLYAQAAGQFDPGNSDNLLEVTGEHLLRAIFMSK